MTFLRNLFRRRPPVWGAHLTQWSPSFYRALAWHIAEASNTGRRA